MRRKICGYCPHLRDDKRHHLRCACKTVGAPFASLLQGGKCCRVLRTCETASGAICSASASQQVAPFAPHLYRTRSLVLCVCLPNDFALRNGARVGITESNMGKEWRFFVEKVKKRSARDSPANRFWRRHPDLNRGVRVLQTLALPLGYGADFPFFGK